jgi:hypothetical protein
VVSVPAGHGDVAVKFSRQNVLPVIFPPGEPAEQAVYDELLKRLQTKANNEGIELKNGTELSMRAQHVHAECTLLAYHLQHPQIDPCH